MLILLSVVIKYTIVVLVVVGQRIMVGIQFENIFLDIDPARLEFAKKVGATHTVLIERGASEEDVAKKVSDEIGGAPDRTIECSGAQFSVNLGVIVCLTKHSLLKYLIETIISLVKNTTSRESSFSDSTGNLCRCRPTFNNLLGNLFQKFIVMYECT